MTLPPPPDFDPTRPKWTQIAEALRQRITTGDHPPHHRLSEVPKDPMRYHRMRDYRNQA